MKKIYAALVVVIVFMILVNGLDYYFDNPGLYCNKERSVTSVEEIEYEKYIERVMAETVRLEKYGTQVTATIYNPTTDQCDPDPLITADNSKIDLQKLESGELKWIAVSRDLREKFGYGTKVLVSGHPDIDGVYEVRDTMNPRWRNRIDILRPVGVDTGKYVVRIVSLEKD